MSFLFPFFTRVFSLSDSLQSFLNFFVGLSCIHCVSIDLLVFDQFDLVDGTLLMRDWTCFGIEKMLSRGLYGPRMRQHSCSNSVVIQFPSLILYRACRLILTSYDELEGFHFLEVCFRVPFSIAADCHISHLVLLFPWFFSVNI